ncbi:MAG: HD domain-containing protein, partial [Bacteroides acidifaciens]|nr:HD domain-containing protein [Bacteroides acidifaciens]
MDWKLIEDKSWSSLEQQFEWVREMNTVPQDTRYHAEGNVAVHTRMVLEALQQSAAYQFLSALEKEIVWAAALLHDVEKRSTSVDEGEGRVSAKGHARKGEYTARTILYRDCPAPFRIREQIASLVRYHGLPIWLMEKPDSVKKLCEASLRVDTSLLKILSEADVRGRICDDKKELLEAVELFEIFCREQDCWNKPREFATNYARFHYFHTEGGYIDYIHHEQFKCEVTMLSGLPGMGKDYYIQSSGMDMPVVCLDAIRRKHKLS